MNRKKVLFIFSLFELYSVVIAFKILLSEHITGSILYLVFISRLLRVNKSNGSAIARVRVSSITNKGIPIISKEDGGEVIQHAEIERDEIIFTLEVTKKLEELSKKGTDEAAIEAGKLLVKEILFNTDDRTGLINTIE